MKNKFVKASAGKTVVTGGFISGSAVAKKSVPVKSIKAKKK